MFQMSGSTDSFAWLVPIFFIYLLGDCYRAKDKREWFKSSAKVSALVLIFMLPMRLIGFFALFEEVSLPREIGGLITRRLCRDSISTAHR